MRLKWVMLLALVMGVGGWVVTTTLQAQSRSNDANITMMDNCSDSDACVQRLWRLPRRCAVSGLELLQGRRQRGRVLRSPQQPVSSGWRADRASLVAQRTLVHLDSCGSDGARDQSRWPGAYVHEGERLRRRLCCAAQRNAQSRAGVRKSRRFGVRAVWRVATGVGACARAAQVPVLHTPVDARGGSHQLEINYKRLRRLAPVGATIHFHSRRQPIRPLDSRSIDHPNRDGGKGCLLGFVTPMHGDKARGHGVEIEWD